MGRVGFIGLGNLGFAMAKRLKEKSVDLVVWNRTRAKAERLGVPVAFSPAELISASDSVIVNVFDSAAVADLLMQPDGLLRGSCAGKIIVDTTTNHPDRVAEFHTLLESKGAQYLEAPVLGSVGPASQGALTMIVSGSSGALDTVKPVVEILCRLIFFVGKPGVATRLKLINNFVLGSFMATIAEAVAAGEKAGLERETILGVLAAGAGNSTVLQGKKEKLLRGDFTPQFSSAAILKDLNYLEDLFSGITLSSESLSALRKVFQKAIAEGLGDDDFSAVIRLFQA